MSGPALHACAPHVPARVGSEQSPAFVEFCLPQRERQTTSKSASSYVSGGNMCEEENYSRASGEGDEYAHFMDTKTESHGR